MKFAKRKKYIFIIAILILSVATLIGLGEVVQKEHNVNNEIQQIQHETESTSELISSESVKEETAETTAVEERNSEETAETAAVEESNSEEPDNVISSEVSTEIEVIEESNTITEETIPTEEPEQSTETTAAPVKSELERVSEEIGLFVDKVSIDLAGVEGNYDLLFVNDMHIVTMDGVTADSLETVTTRREVMFRTSTGMYSADAWLELSSVLDDFYADGIIFGGDMMDFASVTNIDVLSRGLNQISTPYMYLRADHDLGTWYSGGSLTAEDALSLHSPIGTYQDVYVMDFAEFYVIGWNNSTGQLTDEGMEIIQSVWNNGKPIIFATHVPINSIVDSSLAQASSDFDPQGRIKLWGDGCLYQPYDNTSTLLGMLYDSTSPVKAVLSGHLHFKYTVQLTEQTTEYVFNPAFSGSIAQITVQ